MKIEKYLVAFLDLLGASDKLQKPDYSCDMIQVAYDMAKNAISSEHRHSLPCCKAYTFSDNIALCARIYEENELQTKLERLASIVADMMWMNAGMPQNVSLKGNTFMTPVRGAICYGDLCVDDEMNFIIGEALANAYILESKKAKVPRVILDCGLAKYISNTNIFSRDDDGYYFVDYLCCKCSNKSIIANGIISKHTELISTELQRCFSNMINNERKVSKYIWLAKYFNNFISQHMPIYNKYKVNLDELYIID